MKISGQCHCGAIAYEAEVEPDGVLLCHCTDCQQLTGTPYRPIARAPAATFNLTRGTPTIYIKKTADNGQHRRHAFCAECGSPIYATSMDAAPPTYSLRVGTINERAQLSVRRQQWMCSALPWALDLRAIERVEKQ